MIPVSRTRTGSSSTTLSRGSRVWHREGHQYLNSSSELGWWHPMFMMQWPFYSLWYFIKISNIRREYTSLFEITKRLKESNKRRCWEVWSTWSLVIWQNIFSHLLPIRTLWLYLINLNLFLTDAQKLGGGRLGGAVRSLTRTANLFVWVFWWIFCVWGP